MSLIELTHQVNDRLNGGDKSKLIMMFIIVNEILFAYKTCHGEDVKEMVSEGDLDDIIMEIIELYIDDIDLEDELSMIGFFHQKFVFFRSGLSSV